MTKQGIGLAISSAMTLLIVAVVLYKQDILTLDAPYLRLSAIVLVGLGLTVVLMGALVLVYAAIGISDQRQALGLPEGSVRALLAFSLVLIFVCLAAYLFSSVNTQVCDNCTKSMTRVNDALLADLKSNFVVAAEQAKDNNGKLLYEQIPGQGANGASTVDDLKHPLYSVSYYPKPNVNATDLAKQIFTTLATIFVSVVSFYFGSSVTASAVGAGAKAAQGTAGPTATFQAQLTSALADSHNAQMAVDKASDVLKQAQDAVKAEPEDQAKHAALQVAQKAYDDAKRLLDEKQAKVQTAQKTVSDANS